MLHIIYIKAQRGRIVFHLKYYLENMVHYLFTPSDQYSNHVLGLVKHTDEFYCIHAMRNTISYRYIENGSNIVLFQYITDILCFTHGF